MTEPQTEQDAEELVGLVYIGYAEARELPDGQIVQRGETVHVPASIAGREPDHEQVRLRTEAAGRVQEAMRAGTPIDVEDLKWDTTEVDHGEGLLAQVDQFRPATSRAKPVREARRAHAAQQAATGGGEES